MGLELLLKAKSNNYAVPKPFLCSFNRRAYSICEPAGDPSLRSLRMTAVFLWPGLALGSGEEHGFEFHGGFSREAA
jgi:hypothetical protein